MDDYAYNYCVDKEIILGEKETQKEIILFKM